MSDAPAGPGWWQASDGGWYPPDAAPGAYGSPGPGWWQASDGRWYPPQASPGDPTRVTPTVDTTKAAAPPPGPTTGPISGRVPLVPLGDPPLADDVAAHDPSLGAVLVARADAFDLNDEVVAARAQLTTFEQALGRDDAARDDVRELTDDRLELARVVDALGTGEPELAELERQRSAAARAVTLAESDARSTRIQAIVAGVVLGVLALLVLVLIVL